MTKLENKLKSWVSKGLITNEQSIKIKDYESSKVSSSWVLYSFLLLGAVIVCVGIISLIAVNWESIPDSVKLGLDFLFLAGLIYGCLTAKKKNNSVLFEVLLVVFMLLCLASIGLISQIFHTGGELYQALMFWAIITSGIAVISRKTFAPFIWACGFFIALIFSVHNSDIFSHIFAKQIQPVLMAIPLLSLVLMTLCYYIDKESPQTKVFRTWAVLSGLIVLIIAETQAFTYRGINFGLTAFIISYVLVVLNIAGIYLNSNYRVAQRLLLSTTLILYLIPFHLPIFEIKSATVYAIFTIIILMLISIFLASMKKRKLFQLFLIALGTRFLVLYFQALGGLATTGLSLIVSGLIIIGSVFLWHKYRRAIADWAEGLI